MTQTVEADGILTKRIIKSKLTLEVKLSHLIPHTWHKSDVSPSVKMAKSKLACKKITD